MGASQLNQLTIPKDDIIISSTFTTTTTKSYLILTPQTRAISLSPFTTGLFGGSPHHATFSNYNRRPE
jgi:hypothetical protein